MTQLLVSVRSVAEAEAALEGGADIIDVKEPSRGSLGMAPEEVIVAIDAFVAGRVPLSVARGEFTEWGGGFRPFDLQRISWMKFGLAGCDALVTFPQRLANLASAMQGSILVPAAYADAERARGPSVWQVLEALPHWNAQVLLVDTWHKDGRGLFSWLSMEELQRLRRETTERGIKLALAGSLSATDIPHLLKIVPDIIAVRGAACRQGVRVGEIDVDRVVELKQHLSRGRG